MIMNRKDTTEMLNKLTEKRLNSQYSYWASEVTLDKGFAENRVDYLGFKLNYVQNVIRPSSVELGKFDCYEVKSCMEDYKSGNGLNFYGDNNFLVTTREVANKLRSELKFGAVNILVPDKPCIKLITFHDGSIYNNGRIRVASELLWAMVVANKK